MEVHPVRKDKPMKQKEAQVPTLTDEYRKRENVENVHSGKMYWEPPNQNISVRESEVHFKSHTTKNYWRGGFSLQTNAEHSGKVIEEEYIDPKEKPSSQEITERLSTGTGTTGYLTAEGQAVPSELSSSHKTMESLLTSADKTGWGQGHEAIKPQYGNGGNFNNQCRLNGRDYCWGTSSSQWVIIKPENDGKFTDKCGVGSYHVSLK